MIRIAIIDDHAIVRAGLRQFFSEQVDLTVVAEAANGRDAIDIASSCTCEKCMLPSLPFDWPLVGVRTPCAAARRR